MSRSSPLLIRFYLVALVLFSAMPSIIDRHFFDVASSSRKAVLALVLFLLPASFIVSSILARRMENGIFRLLYFSTGLWLGVDDPVTFFVFAWAAWETVRLVGYSPARPYSGGVAVVLELVFWLRCGMRTVRTDMS
jgi:hypothetical protein